MNPVLADNADPRKVVRTKAKSTVMRRVPLCREQLPDSGFSLLEMTVVVAVILTLSAITAPKIVRMVELQRLQTTALSYASFIQQCRYRSVQDGQWYEILLDTSNAQNAVAYLDINGDGARQATEPALEIPSSITVADPTTVPAGFGNSNLLGATPLTVNTTPATWNQTTQTAGLEFNERGLPCWRASASAACTNTAQINSGGVTVSAPVAWITYLTSAGATSNDYAAITVTPAGRVRTWRYQSDSGGSWQ